MTDARLPLVGVEVLRRESAVLVVWDGTRRTSRQLLVPEYPRQRIDVVPERRNRDQIARARAMDRARIPVTAQPQALFEGEAQ